MIIHICVLEKMIPLGDTIICLLSSEEHKLKLLKVQLLLTEYFLAVTEMKPWLHLHHIKQPGLVGSLPIAGGLELNALKGPF